MLGDTGTALRTLTLPFPRLQQEGSKPKIVEATVLYTVSFILGPFGLCKGCRYNADHRRELDVRPRFYRGLLSPLCFDLSLDIAANRVLV